MNFRAFTCGCVLLVLGVWGCAGGSGAGKGDVGIALDVASREVGADADTVAVEIGTVDTRLTDGSTMDTGLEEVDVPDTHLDQLADEDSVDSVFPEDIELPPMPACPQAPPKCNQEGGVDGPVEGVVTETLATGFRLYDLNTWDEADEILDTISAHWSAATVTLDTVLQDLDRTAQKVTEMEDTACFHEGFVWNLEDTTVMYWYPQGIAGSATATADGTWNGRKLAVVTWYHKPEEDSSTDRNKGARVAIVDYTNMNDIRYRMALLVEPYWNEGQADLKPIEIHAGGLGWAGNYLYIADTSKGFRVFDMQRILQVQTGDPDALGFGSEEAGYQAFDYRYAIPQVSAYRLTDESCCARFSFASIDLSTHPPTLLSGEYSADSIAGRLHAWPFDVNSGRLMEIDGVVVSSWASFPGVSKMQGALTRDDHLFVSSSYDMGIFYEAPIGDTLKSHPWSYFPEDLHFSAFSGSLWCLTEMPGYRFVFAVQTADILSNCDE